MKRIKLNFIRTLNTRGITEQGKRRYKNKQTRRAFFFCIVLERILLRVAWKDWGALLPSVGTVFQGKTSMIFVKGYWEDVR